MNGGDGPDLEAVEPERLTGTGTRIANGSSDESDGDCVGRIRGSSSLSAASRVSSAWALTNLCHADMLSRPEGPAVVLVKAAA